MNKIALAVIIGLAVLALAILSGRFWKQTGPGQKPDIIITNDVKHSIPLEEIRDGGPPPDGIPPIDNPKFTSVNGAGAWLADAEVGLAFSVGSVHRFYPFQILVWHEIVNDTVDNQRVLVTYCPLCRTAIVFDPIVNNQPVEFGTSGKLWNSNLLMYDRQTKSLWSQVLGEAVVGAMTGAKLKILPSDIIRFGDWKKLYPAGEVLTRATGVSRPYGQDPYGDYYTAPGTIFPVSKIDNRLGDKDFVLGIVVDNQAKAYSEAAVKKAGVIEDNLGGKTIIVRYNQDSQSIRIFEKGANGGETSLPIIGAFWFSWAAAHPNTELYK